MRILVTGNLGYIGSVVVPHLKRNLPDCEIIGLDIALFSSCFSNAIVSPDIFLTQQLFGDVRTVDQNVFKDIDAVVHLAAISNDPIGNRFEDITDAINFRATARIATLAKQAGVKHFIFASSCSVYGYHDDAPRTESSETAPLTAYAVSKIRAEEALYKLADRDFLVTCHRFATACGSSPRIRLDLVLNDFVFNALKSSAIRILSNGTPWRPLISVNAMARAIEWSCNRPIDAGGEFLIINTGHNDWNYQVLTIAEKVRDIIPCSIQINDAAASDSRSYKVDFSLYKKLAPDFYVADELASTIKELSLMLSGIAANVEFKQFIRLETIQQLIQQKHLSADFTWNLTTAD